MGIPGLMTYINQYSDIYFMPHRLHNTYLVIDGNSIASQLYTHDAKGNSCFGGDYDKYACSVSNFFDELLKCNITPFVIIDGGSEEKKLTTIYQRTKDRVKTASMLTPGRQTRSQLFPLLLKEVFKDIAQQKGVKCAHSLFEADEDIASVARILNCPVLSFDSDFYIYDVMYIPYNTLDNGVCRNPYGEGFVKNCKVYKIEYFLQRFPGMDRTVMPLAATLLGNDYISRRTFKDFFCTLKLSKQSKRRYNELQRRIEATFRWLQKQTLDSAIARVLSKLDPKKREQILEVMEMIINGYLIPSSKMLFPLGFSSDNVRQLMQSIPKERYHFRQDIYNLKVVEEPKAEDESDLSCDEDNNTPPDQLDIVKPENERNLYKLAPFWFIEKFHGAHFPSYFIDMLTRQMYFCPVQIEDFAHPTCINISLKIIRVIFKLLNSGTSNASVMEYVARGKLTNISTYKLHCDDHIFHCKFPPLAQLADLPFIIRKEIFDNALGITGYQLDDFPPHWRLFIATAHYWINEAEPIFSTNCHLYALLFGMMYHVIDRQIGFHRSQAYFERNFSRDVAIVHQARYGLIPPPVQNISLSDALYQVSREDCLIAAPFFLTNFIIDQGLLMNPKKFHVSSVHAFSLFQNCLRHSSHLNALLGYPYESVHVAELLNGTLLYNLYNNFKSRQDVDSYIGQVLRDSPSLLQLFVSLVTAVRTICGKAFENRVNARKRKKNRNRAGGSNQAVDGEEGESEEEDDDQGGVPYYDVNNRYAALNAHSSYRN